MKHKVRIAYIGLLTHCQKRSWLRNWTKHVYSKANGHTIAARRPRPTWRAESEKCTACGLRFSCLRQNWVLFRLKGRHYNNYRRSTPVRCLNCAQLFIVHVRYRRGLKRIENDRCGPIRIWTTYYQN